MKMKHKKFYKIMALILGVLTFTSCTANFCSVQDRAHILYQYDQGLLYDETGEAIINEGVIQFKSEEITKQIQSLSEKYDVPSINFWKAIDNKVLAMANEKYEIAYGTSGEKDVVLEKFGYLKFFGETVNKKGKTVDTLWANWDKMVDEIYSELSVQDYPSKDFITQYKSHMNTYVSNKRTCITPESGNYGETGNEVYVEGKSWGDAFGKGLIEGLLVYPVAWLSHTFAKAFINIGVGNGWSQLLAILFVTIIVRGLLMLVTFKSTMDQQKMTALQPELAKIQQKYPNANTNQHEKQMLAQAQMALYQKHKINPLSQLLVLIIQFPVFIAVWGALSGSSILTSGDILGMNLGSSIGTVMMKFDFTSGWWTAVVLFILMSATQIVASKLPQWIQAKNVKKVSKMGSNPAVDSQNKQMKIMSTVMLVMIIVMGFSLPSGMGLYWLFGAIMSIAQTLITQTIMKRKKK